MIKSHVTVYHYNDTRSTVTRRAFDNDQRHVTALRPISEAAYELVIRQSKLLAVNMLTCSRGVL